MIAIYVTLALLAVALIVLIRGNSSNERAASFGLAVTVVVLAAVVMFVAAIGSLWLYPLS
jgi:hypothetical protein